MFGFDKKNKKGLPENCPGAVQTTLSDRLGRTRTSLFERLFSHSSGIVNNETLEDLKDRLLLADVGIKTADQVIRVLKEDAGGKTLEHPIALLKKTLFSVLEPIEKPLVIPENSKKPYLILVVGVNGVGKTTTIGKLTKHLQDEGKSVMLAAGDTFRAAAIEQLQVWGTRNNVKVISQKYGSDPGAVIYDALKSSRANNTDVLIADTAGRLHNKKNLMEEMKKIHRVSNKFDTELLHEVMLILDAGTGQNALSQTKQFDCAIGVDSIVLTKLDGTAKGGIIFSLADRFNIPIPFIGIGEKVEDFRPFNACEFIEALLMQDIETSD